MINIVYILLLSAIFSEKLMPMIKIPMPTHLKLKLANCP